MGGRTSCPSRQTIFVLPRLSPAGDRLVVHVGASLDLWTYDLRPGHYDQVDLGPHRGFFGSGMDPGRKPRHLRHMVRWRRRARLGTGRRKRPCRGALKGVGMRSFERTNPVMLPDGNGVIMTGLAPAATVEDLLLVPLAGERAPGNACCRLQASSGIPRSLRTVVSSPTTRTNRVVPKCTCARSRTSAREGGKSPLRAEQVPCGRAAGARSYTRTAKAASWRLRCESTATERFDSSNQK